jgi:hypothetical protein
MSSHQLSLDASDLVKAAEDTQRLREGLADRKALNAKIAHGMAELTRAYLRTSLSDRHRSANRLGARPTGHYARQAQFIQHASNDDVAIVRYPKSSGLGRAFHQVTILPTGGRKLVVRPACAETYGKMPSEFPPETFAFTVVGGRFPALVWRKDWTVAYWAARKFTQKQDRSLLPSDAAYINIGHRSTKLYLDSLQ